MTDAAFIVVLTLLAGAAFWRIEKTYERVSRLIRNVAMLAEHTGMDLNAKHENDDDIDGLSPEDLADYQALQVRRANFLFDSMKEREMELRGENAALSLRIEELEKQIARYQGDA